MDFGGAGQQKVTMEAAGRATVHPVGQGASEVLHHGGLPRRSTEIQQQKLSADVSDFQRRLRENPKHIQFTVGTKTFNKLFYLVDGIYPALTRFIKTLNLPITAKEKKFAVWQSARKDVERAFGVLQSKWRLLSSPLEKSDETKIQTMFLACIVMHNMMVQERLEQQNHNEFYCMDYFIALDDTNVDQDVFMIDESEEFITTMTAELARSQPCQQFQQHRRENISETQQIIMHRWSKLYDEKEQTRLRDELIEETNKF